MIKGILLSLRRKNNKKKNYANYSKIPNGLN